MTLTPEQLEQQKNAQIKQQEEQKQLEDVKKSVEMPQNTEKPQEIKEKEQIQPTEQPQVTITHGEGGNDRIGNPNTTRIPQKTPKVQNTQPTPTNKDYTMPKTDLSSLSAQDIVDRYEEGDVREDEIKAIAESDPLKYQQITLKKKEAKRKAAVNDKHKDYVTIRNKQLDSYKSWIKDNYQFNASERFDQRIANNPKITKSRDLITQKQEELNKLQTQLSGLYNNVGVGIQGSRNQNKINSVAQRIVQLKGVIELEQSLYNEQVDFERQGFALEMDDRQRGLEMEYKMYQLDTSIALEDYQYGVQQMEMELQGLEKEQNQLRQDQLIEREEQRQDELRQQGFDREDQLRQEQYDRQDKLIEQEQQSDRAFAKFSASKYFSSLPANQKAELLNMNPSQIQWVLAKKWQEEERTQQQIEVMEIDGQVVTYNHKTREVRDLINHGSMLDFIKGKEGFRSKSYQDSVGVWTIGYGTTKRPNGEPVKPGQTISEEEASVLMTRQIEQQYMSWKSLVDVPINEDLKTALTSFEYNLGSGIWSTTAKGVISDINKGDYESAADLMRKHNKGRINGKLTPIKGLTIRRNEEAALLLRSKKQQKNISDGEYNNAVYSPNLSSVYDTILSGKQPTKTVLEGLEDAGYSIYELNQGAQIHKQKKEQAMTPMIQTMIDNLRQLEGISEVDYKMPGYIPRNKGQDYRSLYEQVVSSQAMQQLVDLKNQGATFGALSDSELSFITNMSTSLNYKLTHDEFKKRAKSMRESLEGAVSVTQHEIPEQEIHEESDIDVEDMFLDTFDMDSALGL